MSLASFLQALGLAALSSATVGAQLPRGQPVKDTVVAFAQVTRDLTGDGRPEVLKLVGRGPSIYELQPTLTIEEDGRLIFTDDFLPITRRIGFDGATRIRTDAEHRQFLQDFGNWVFESSKFSPPSEFRRQLRSSYAHDPPDFPPLVDRTTWAEIASSNAVVFSYSRGGDNAESIVWVESRKKFVRLVHCC